jgi:hypothetical protein
LSVVRRARRARRRAATTARRGPRARAGRGALTFEVTGLDRRALEALRLELLRLGETSPGFRLSEFRVMEADGSP